MQGYELGLAHFSDLTGEVESITRLFREIGWDEYSLHGGFDLLKYLLSAHVYLYMVITKEGEKKLNGNDDYHGKT
jgi:hypothetical protein